MRQFKRIRKHLDRDTAISVANAIVGSRIDYCNSLLFVVPNTHVKKLQSIQNYLAHIVTQTPRYIVCPITKFYKYPSITKTLCDLHWLPVWSLLHFKINLITYKAVTFQQPPFLWNLLEIRDIPHGLRSTRAISLFRSFGGDLVLGPTPTILPKCGMYFPRAYVVLGRSLLSAKPLRPITLTIPQTPRKHLTTITVSCPGS